MPVTLASTSLGERVYIHRLTATGTMRRRLLDLGFTPGNSIVPLYRSPLGDPTAYAVMGTVIALRSSDAETVLVVPHQEEARS